MIDSAQVAAQYGVGRTKAREMMLEFLAGEGLGIRVGRTLRVDEDAFAAWLAAETRAKFEYEALRREALARV